MPTQANTDGRPIALTQGDVASSPTLPRDARLPINRCNLPAVILGSVTYQRHPTPLRLDGISELHAELFDFLDRGADSSERAQLFRDYTAAHFCLDDLEAAGLTDSSSARAKANWMRILRGWSFDADGREGAVLKAWVESRFGLLPRFHGEPLRDFAAPAYLRYQEMRASGLYGTNALESQLDLLYAYCQYEFCQITTADIWLTLYRGVNRLADYERLAGSDEEQVVLLNSLTSFTSSRERAGEFGDYIMTTRVPLPKIFFHYRLLPGILRGEEEYLVIGGAYEVSIRTL
jgi:NAD+--dinitrogen-reductase ADP-D-ribosyltransferase